MKVLLDENLPHEFRGLLSGHEVYTVQYMKWRGLKNGRLLAQAVAAGFEAFLTIDKEIPYEQTSGSSRSQSSSLIPNPTRSITCSRSSPALLWR